MPGLIAEGPGATLFPEIVNPVGDVLWRDSVGHSVRHGIGLAWESQGTTLWILDSDIGRSRVRRTHNTWVKEPASELPSEINKFT